MSWTKTTATTHERRWCVNQDGDAYPESEARGWGFPIGEVVASVQVEEGLDTIVCVSIVERDKHKPLFDGGSHAIALQVHHSEKLLQGERLTLALGHAEQAAIHLTKVYAILERLKALRPSTFWS